MKLIVGLGNPGLRYKFTRHNLGFLVIDRLAADFGIRVRRREYNSLLGRGKIGDEEAILMKPLTYMNLSGRPIAGLARKEGLSLERMMVICDDVNLEFGTIRIRPNGSAGGHNGLQSIIDNLGSQDFPRLRMGIGGSEKIDLTVHVLAPFRKKDLKAAEDLAERAVKALDCWITDGIQAAMGRFNA